MAVLETFLFSLRQTHRSGLLLGRITIFLLLKVSDLLRLVMSLNCADRQTLFTDVPVSSSPQGHKTSPRPVHHLLTAGTWK